MNNYTPKTLQIKQYELELIKECLGHIEWKFKTDFCDWVKVGEQPREQYNRELKRMEKVLDEDGNEVMENVMEYVESENLDEETKLKKQIWNNFIDYLSNYNFNAKIK